MKRLQRLLAVFLSLCLINLTMVQTAQARLISTEEVYNHASLQQAGPGHARLAAALARSDVRAEMERLGVNSASANDRIAALTDEEAASLADQINSAPAGGSIIGAILLIFFVLLLTDILGWTKVYPFTRSIR